MRAEVFFALDTLTRSTKTKAPRHAPKKAAEMRKKTKQALKVVA